MQEQKQRLERVALAEKRANRRDFDTRYGNSSRSPYGIVRPQAYRQKRPAAVTKDVLIVAMLAALVAIIYVVAYTN